jgi:hypothetical protein
MLEAIGMKLLISHSTTPITTNTTTMFNNGIFILLIVTQHSAGQSFRRMKSSNRQFNPLEASSGC